MSVGSIARGARPGSPGAEQTASSTALRAVTLNSTPAGTYTAPGDESSNTVERPPIRSKICVPTLMSAMPVRTTMQALRPISPPPATCQADSRCTRKPTCFQPALCGVTSITHPSVSGAWGRNRRLGIVTPPFSIPPQPCQPEFAVASRIRDARILFCLDNDPSGVADLAKCLHHFSEIQIAVPRHREHAIQYAAQKACV